MIELVDPMFKLVDPMVDLRKSTIDLLEPVVDLLKPKVDHGKPLINRSESGHHSGLQVIEVALGGHIGPTNRGQVFHQHGSLLGPD
ncbi:MAG: hypothetical protein IPG97_01035 [Microthrixaceae bacterium]|nr:hypothetical protein [Microthrixaceae bacterium]